MFDDLEVFLAVAQAESFSAVARNRNVAASSVTRRIDQLEAELGVTLFRRTSRLVQLTDAGELFVNNARAILAELAQAREALSDGMREPKGMLTVSVPAAFGRRHMVAAVSSFLERYPQIEIDLQLSDRLVDLTVERVDVAVRIGELPDSDLVATRLAPLRRIACASPGYLAQSGTPAHPEELLEHQCLTVMSKPQPQGWWCFAEINRGRALPVRGRWRSDDTEALLQAALAGHGIVHLASWMVNDALKHGDLIALFPQAAYAAPTGAAIHAVRLPGRSHATKSQLFIGHLKSFIGEPAYWDLPA